MDSTKTLKLLQEQGLINHPDFIKETLRKSLQEVLNEQFKKHIGADEYERTNKRKGYRNGRYTRSLTTRVGSIELQVSRDREGSFQPDLFERYQRSEKALVLAFVEMYVQGVSTRKVRKILQTLCGVSLSKSLVSNLTRRLDSELDRWHSRPLKKRYPYLILDARYEKIRDAGRVVHKAVVIVIGIDEEGIREVLGNWIIDSESFEDWDGCMKSLKSRGLHGVQFAVSDENKGLRKALKKNFQGVQHQRCQVHFMRNLLAKLSASEKKEGMFLLQDIFAARTKERATEGLERLLDYLMSRKKEQVAHWVEENIEDCLQVLSLPSEHRLKLKSTNMLERLNQEIKRRTRIIRIFPSEESCLRLVSALCQETSEIWSTRKYLPAAE